MDSNSANLDAPVNDQLWNADLAPTDKSAQTWKWTDVGALWVARITRIVFDVSLRAVL